MADGMSVELDKIVKELASQVAKEDITKNRNLTYRKRFITLRPGASEVIHSLTYSLPNNISFESLPTYLSAYSVLLGIRQEVWQTVYQYPRTHFIAPTGAVKDLGRDLAFLANTVKLADVDRVLIAYSDGEKNSVLLMVDVMPFIGDRHNLFVTPLSISAGEVPSVSFDTYKKIVEKLDSSVQVNINKGSPMESKNVTVEEMLRTMTFLMSSLSKNKIATKVGSVSITDGKYASWTVERINAVLYTKIEPDIFPSLLKEQQKMPAQPGDMTFERFATVYKIANTENRGSGPLFKSSVVSRGVQSIGSHKKWDGVDLSESEDSDYTLSLEKDIARSLGGTDQETDSEEWQ